MTRRRRVVRMTRLEEEFQDSIELTARITEPVTRKDAPPPEDPKTLLMRRRERVRNLAVALVEQGRGKRVDEKHIELTMNWKEFQREFEHVHPNAGHVMFYNVTTLRRACRDHVASGEWPHISFKAGRPKDSAP